MLDAGRRREGCWMDMQKPSGFYRNTLTRCMTGDIRH